MLSNDLGVAERAVVELARVALTRDDDGVRQICRRLIRRPPTNRDLAPRLKSELAEVLSAAPVSDSSPLRNAGTSLWSSPKTEENDFLWIEYPRLVHAPVYPSSLASAVESLVTEHQHPGRLESYGLSPAGRVLFTGPPGVGKTLTASYIASQLELPLITVNLASLMSSLMGRTGQNVQEVMGRATKEPCVLLFDEFDAVAKSRGDHSDVGEVKRLANVILQQLDLWSGKGLLIAATNHPDLLDSAVHRRFDLKLPFFMPGFEERSRCISEHDIIQRIGLDANGVALLAFVSAGYSPAEIHNWIRQQARRAITAAPAHDLTPSDLESALLENVKSRAQLLSSENPDNRAQLAFLLKSELRWTHRRIASWLGVSHVTIGKDVARMDEIKSGEPHGG